MTRTTKDGEKMAKDGTNRGGRRPRAGRKRDALADKVAEGKFAETIQFPITVLEGEELGGDSVDLEGEDMPSPSDYLSAKQKMNGKPLGADVIFKETMKWLKDRRCNDLVNPRLVESYSEAFARYMQCSAALSEYGLIAKHPTTKAPIASPFVTMTLSFQKQANMLWYEIFDIVKQNNLTPYEGSPSDDPMENLLQMRSKKRAGG